MTEKGLTSASCGLGTNSSAEIILLYEQNRPPDIIPFSDTGGEKPQTYRFRDIFNTWLIKHGLPEIITIKNQLPQGRIDGSLENECLRLGTLPSKTFGLGKCSLKWKRDPIERYLSQFNVTVRYIGYDAGEVRRKEKLLNNDRDSKELYYEFPLIDAGWFREDCIAALKRHGLPLPGKSACFFCPSSKKHEVLELAKTNPDLYKRAVEMESRALEGTGQAGQLTTIKGLGRHWSWRELVEANEAQRSLFVEVNNDIACACFDGDDD